MRVIAHSNKFLEANYFGYSTLYMASIEAKLRATKRKQPNV